MSEEGHYERSGEREEATIGDVGALGGVLEGEVPTMEDTHKELARDMFEKITEYLNGELAGI